MTPPAVIEPYLSECDIVLTMSVEPGFGGQTFIPHVLDKIRRLKTLVGPTTLLSIDGGISQDNIRVAADAGCQVFVAGSAIFDESDYTLPLSILERLAKNTVDGASSP